MTREEAIKVLEMFLHKQCDLKRTEFAYDQNTVWEAVNMASKALEQEHCPLVEIVTCKDCRHWNFNENSSILCGYCSNFETETNEYFYCMDGERRE